MLHHHKTCQSAQFFVILVHAGARRRRGLSPDSPVRSQTAGPGVRQSGEAFKSNFNSATKFQDIELSRLNSICHKKIVKIRVEPPQVEILTSCFWRRKQLEPAHAAKNSFEPDYSGSSRFPAGKSVFDFRPGKLYFRPKIVLRSIESLMMASGVWLLGGCVGAASGHSTGRAPETNKQDSSVCQTDRQTPVASTLNPPSSVQTDRHTPLAAKVE